MRFVAFLLFLFLLPLSLFITFLIYFPTRTNVLFLQPRIGLAKKEFIVYKFKTMENNKITAVGKYLRKLGLDEIPQLLNIMKGEMSFIGPRPLTFQDIKRLEWNQEKFADRWSVKPGITGLAQLTNVCSAELSMKNDLFYIKNKSFFMDFKIIFRTIFVPVLGKFTK